MNYIWSLKELKKTPKNGLKVFSCFSCGGGSSMGYKLAGYDVLGNVEIDKAMMEIYQENNKPKYPYLMDIRDFNKIPDNELPPELFDLDILDGSPPCSTFSIAGKREKKWGNENHFREGQVKQRLDTLFLDFIDTAAKLKPKIVIAENVRGLIYGNAKGYVTEILSAFRNAGYYPKIYSFNSATMGVPQTRERIFFIARRQDLEYPDLKFHFDEKPIRYSEIKSKTPGPALQVGSKKYNLWKCRRNGDLSLADISIRLYNKISHFNSRLLIDSRVVNTIASTSAGRPIRFDSPRYISDDEIIKSQTFPQDYNFGNNDVQYVCGMSVPPIMMARIASEIYEQWLKTD